MSKIIRILRTTLPQKEGIIPQTNKHQTTDSKNSTNKNLIEELRIKKVKKPTIREEDNDRDIKNKTMIVFNYLPI